MLLLAPPDGLLAGIIVIGSMKNDLRAVGFGGRNLDQRSSERHANLGFDSLLTRVISQPLSMISCRSRDYTLPALLRRKSQQFVKRASLFECPGSLQVV